jgi:hypothetical protein
MGLQFAHLGPDAIAPAACASNGGGVSTAAPLGSDAVQSPAHSLAPLTVLTSLRPCGAFGFTVQACCQDDEGGRLERFVPVIAVEVVTGAEISYRERCIRGFEWRVQRKARLEEERVNTNSRSNAKSANDSGNSNRPELIGCSIKPHRCRRGRDPRVC